MSSFRLIPDMHPMADPDMIFCLGNARITLITPALIRLEFSPERQFCDEATQSVWFRNLGDTDATITQNAAGTRLTLATAKAIFDLDLEKQALHVSLPGGRSVTLTPDAQPPALPGTCRTLDGCDGLRYISFTPDHEPRASHVTLRDAIVSRDGVAVFDDSASLILGQDGFLHARPPERDLYIFAHGHNYREAVRDLYRITGYPPVVPRFALGNWWSRYHAYTDREYLDLMDSFRDQHLPFTVATVDMDWHLVHNLPENEDGWTGYTWNRELFPDPKQFLDELHSRDMHVTLNLHPALGVRFFEDAYPDMARAMGIDPKSRKPVEFDPTNPEFLKAYFEILHHPLEDMGVDFWWIDWQQGTSSRMAGLDPLWSLNHYHTLDARRRRGGLILSRYAGIGSHRYPLGFSGDTFITWETMKLMPYFTASAANTGFGWWSHDIGGHMMGIKNNELYLRFVQFGVFSPISRLHGTNLALLHKEPEFFGNGTGLIAGRFLRLRHAMIPMLYTASLDMSETGQQLIEPMYYGWPEEEESYASGGQYLFLQHFIAAPVTSPLAPDGYAVQSVFVPEGRWTDLFTGREYEGGRRIPMARDLTSFPLLAAEGSFFVLDHTFRPPERLNADDLPSALKVLVCSGQGSYTLTEDGPDTGRARTQFSIRPAEDTDFDYEITIASEDPDAVLPARSMDLELRNAQDAAVRVFCGETPVHVRPRTTSLGTAVHLDRVVPGQTWRILFRDTLTPWQKHERALADCLSRLEMDNGSKEKIHKALLACSSPSDAEALLSVHPLPEGYRTSVMECFCGGAVRESSALPN